MPSAWEDVYDIESIDYVHSHWKFFENIYKKNNIKLNQSAKESVFEKAIASVFLILDKQVLEWKAMRKAFIEEGIRRKVFTSTDPVQSLARWNKLYKELNEGKKADKNLGAMNKLLDITAKFPTASSGGKTQKYLKFIEDNLEDAFNSFITIVDYISSKSTTTVDFLEANDYKSVKLLSSTDTSVVRGITSINAILSTMGIRETGAGGLKKLKKDLMSAKNKLLATGDQVSFEQLNTFFTLFGRQKPQKYLNNTIIQGNPAWIDSKGTLFESIVEDALVKKKLAVPPVDVDTGIQLSKTTTSDVLSWSFNYDSKTITGGVSLKTTASGSFNTGYSPADFLNSPVFKEVQNGMYTNSMISWLRANILTLNTFNVGDQDAKLKIDTIQVETKKGVKDQDVTVATDTYLQEFLDLEEFLAGLMILPRALDGVYKYQDTILLPEFENKLYYTALINLKERFVWVADLAEKLINSLKTNLDNNPYYKFKAKQEKNTSTSFKFGYDKKTLEDFYNKKRAVLANMENILYKNISSAMFSEINQIYNSINSNTLISRIEVSLDYKKLV